MWRRNTASSGCYPEIGTASVASDDRDPFIIIDLELMPEPDVRFLIVNEIDA